MTLRNTRKHEVLATDGRCAAQKVRKTYVFFGSRSDRILFTSDHIFDFCFEVPEAREVFKNLPGARGIIFPKYEPVPSHPDPIQPQNHDFFPPGHFCQPTNFVDRPVLLWVDLPIYSPSKFGDPSRLVRNALVCRHFITNK